MSAPAVRCERLSKSYQGRPPIKAVQNLDLRIDVGECFGLLGPNGSGKTTTVEILAGLMKPDSGEIEILGMNWMNDGAAIRPRIGISLQETRLPDKLAVVEVLFLFRSFYPRGIHPDQMMASLGLTEKSRAWVRSLSGGLRQRLEVACALIGDPELLFLDEPTAGLDPTARRQIWDLLHSFRKKKRTVLLTTHSMEEAERICNRVAIMDSGRVLALGSPSELIGTLGGKYLIELEIHSENSCSMESISNALHGISTVHRISVDKRYIRLAVKDPTVTIPEILANLGGLGQIPLNMSTRPVSLEDVFLSLTGCRIDEFGAASV